MPKILSSQNAGNMKIINELFYVQFALSLKSGMCFIVTMPPIQSNYFPVLSHHVWPGAARLSLCNGLAGSSGCHIGAGITRAGPILDLTQLTPAFMFIN